MKHRARLGGILLAASLVCAAAQVQTSGSAVAFATGMTLNAELTSSVDSKKAKVGDVVNARLSEALRADGALLLPKGAKLLGHLTQSSARCKDDPSSSLAIQFDKALLKDGQEIPLTVWIRALAAEPRTVFQQGPEQDLNAGTPAAGQSPMGASRPSMGGPPAAKSPSIVGSTNGSASETTASGGLNAFGQLSAQSKGVFGLDGIHLAADASSATQGSLITSSGRSVHLDSGTRLLLVWQAETPAPSSK